MFIQMNGERERIISSIIQLVYFMRGSIQYDNMFEMSMIERSMVRQFVEDRLEIEAKKTYPQY